ncbi:MAG: hypothetical protein RL302_787 [Pseudomonadota bacterium]|jgi:hypothetical protein
MIVFTRTASIAPGQNLGAMVFAREVAVHIKKTTGVQLEVMVPVGGNPSRVAWTTRHENLGVFEQFQSTVSADMAYLQMVAGGADNFIAGSLEDSIWKLV